MTLSGGCLCGAISFATEASPVTIANCHCTDCQKATGAAYATLVFVPVEGLQLTGTPQRYEHASDRGSKMTKHFCGSCGTPVFSENAARAGLIGLRAGVIDQKDAITPERNIFTASKIASTPLDPALPRFERMPG